MAIGMVLMKMKCMFLMVLSVGFVKSDVDKDREECATQLGLATCLHYVGGTAKAPTPDCCTGVKQVLTTSKKCLCILIKDRNDPSLGLKINATLALGLPAISLLHLSPNSPDAKVFEDFNNIANGNTTASTPPAASKALLHLSPNSPDAKVFEDYNSMSNGTTTTAPASTVSAVLERDLSERMAKKFTYVPMPQLGRRCKMGLQM
ncbi:hypothetical protein MKW98_021463 [Papaver atlanticum]|uniref:Bifunctional inhibitor/plant lipid transfer protein/seed storage helical domain-containing protein n=1 Tax=Papaver atlanticum TaxID=357466 RepID=A0AAD4SSW2_9MAGN|nr:hypothetical protein MKW98_021463 [Papaver atlanticum]